jgi:hypothetical protein
VATLNPEQRRAIKKLKQNDLVRWVKYNYYNARVLFNDGIKETWILRENKRKAKPSRFYHNFPSANLLSERGLTMYQEFETNPLEKEEYQLLQPFFIIQRSDIDRAGFIDIRLMVHKIITRLMSEGWIDLKYPTSVLRDDLKRLKQCDPNRFFCGGGTISAYLQYGKSIPGRAIVEHFLKWGECTDGRKTFQDSWVRPQSLYMSIDSLMRGRKDITRSNVVRKLSVEGGRRNAGPKFTNPWFYYSIIKSFFPSINSVYDSCPEWGSKLLACSLMGSSYHYEGDFLDRVASYVGCERKPKNNYDLAILSDNQPLNASEALEKIERFSKISKNMLVLVGPDDIDTIKDVYPFRRKLKAQMCPNFLLDQIGHHYFLIY